MARTRDEIEALVESHTKKSNKDSLMHSLCDSALKQALLKHTFEDSRSIPSDVAIVEDATSCVLPTGTREIITVRIVDSVTTASARLLLKPQTWWDKYIITPADNVKGWPKYGLRFGTNLIVDRPVEANITARFRISTVPVFTNGSTECPIRVLDIFVEYFVTAFVFLNIEDKENYLFWLGLAKAAFKDGMDADSRMPAMDVSIHPEDGIRRHPFFSTEIGTGFDGDFSGLGTATWF